MTPPPASTAGTSRTLLASNERVGELSDLLAKAVGDGRDHFEQDALLASRRSTRTQQLVLFGGLAGIAFAALMGSRSPEQTSSRNWLSVSTTPSKREASARRRSVGRRGLQRYPSGGNVDQPS